MLSKRDYFKAQLFVHRLQNLPIKVKYYNRNKKNKTGQTRTHVHARARTHTQRIRRILGKWIVQLEEEQA